MKQNVIKRINGLLRIESWVNCASFANKFQECDWDEEMIDGGSLKLTIRGASVFDVALLVSRFFQSPCAFNRPKDGHYKLRLLPVNVSCNSIVTVWKASGEDVCVLLEPIDDVPYD